MFQFTTTTVINSNEDYTTGLPLFSGQAAEGDKPGSMNVKRGLNFKQPNVVGITKCEYVAPKIAEATLDLDALNTEFDLSDEGALLRLAIYVKLCSTSANSYYANDLVFKGKPFYIEFVWKKGADAKAVAKHLKEIAKKYMVMVYEKDLIKVSVTDAGVVTIKGIDEYQRFVKVNIEKFVEHPNPAIDGHFEPIKIALPTTMEYLDKKQSEPNPDYDANFKIEQGVEGFGTYQWIVKNLRLPTAARTAWTAINADEAPIIGAKYNQYIIRYCVNRGIMGGDAVGEVTKSLTTHVFYVNQGAEEELTLEFEDALEKILPTGGKIEVVPPQD